MTIESKHERYTNGVEFERYGGFRNSWVEAHRNAFFGEEASLPHC